MDMLNNQMANALSKQVWNMIITTQLLNLLTPPKRQSLDWHLKLKPWLARVPVRAEQPRFKVWAEPDSISIGENRNWTHIKFFKEIWVRLVLPPGWIPFLCLWTLSRRPYLLKGIDWIWGGHGEVARVAELHRSWACLGTPHGKMRVKEYPGHLNVENVGQPLCCYFWFWSQRSQLYITTTRHSHPYQMSSLPLKKMFVVSLHQKFFNAHNHSFIIPYNTRSTHLDVGRIQCFWLV